ncbi:MAG: SurA N-terminal domain-containing protein [Desulfobulbaceae bacterium]|uniref:SurA N-terminal domain-containing protein n=1 Tax=Candidatus Desulfatifera sulfidica TaxID=2841691 RepID=A0A8J6N9C3_9BACT|nr:SurA N-terminal domain-containing protein [Candidatus Desulfatifera sulfidica]
MTEKLSSPVPTLTRQPFFTTRFGLCLLSLFTLLLTFSPAPGQAELVDRVVAVVNDEVITLSEVNEEGQPFFKKISTQVEAHELSEAIARAREEVLNGLIDKRLIAQEAAKLRITVTEQEVAAAAQRIRDQNGVDRDAFLAELDTMGLSEAGYLDNLKNQILQSKLINYEVRSKIVITDDQVLDYYDENYTRRVNSGGYYLLQMGFSWNADKDERDEARQRADRVRNLVLAGQDFGELAEKFSDLPSAKDGGDIGEFQETDMAEAMRTAITPLAAGDISPIIEIGAGFQFFKLVSSRQGGIVYQAPFESVQEKIRKDLYEKQLTKEFDIWVKKIKNEAYIKRL